MVTVTEGNIVDTLTFRIVADLKQNGIDKPWLADLVRAHVIEVLQVVQDRLYQDVAANLMDITRQLHPPSARGVTRDADYWTYGGSDKEDVGVVR